MRRSQGLVCGLIALVLATPAAAQLTYYAATIEIGNRNSQGYVTLDWSDPKNAQGELCLQDDSEDGEALRVSLSASNPQPDLLQLHLPKIASMPFEEPLQLYRGKVKSTLLQSRIPQVTTIWKYRNYRSQPTIRAISLQEFPNDLRNLQLSISFSGNDSTYERTGSRSEPVKYHLRNYDGLSKEAIIASESKNPYFGDGGYTRGRVLALVPRNRLEELRQFLLKEGGGAVIEEDGAPSTWRATPYDRLESRRPRCEGPVARVSISVSPFLEFYYVRKLQTSGVVLTAYVEQLGAGAGFASFRTKNKRFTELFSAANIRLEEKDRELWSLLHRHVRAFIEARRPDFKERGTIARLHSGGVQALSYRMEIVGPAFAECTRNRWEKIVLQVVPQAVFMDNLILLFQIQEGFFAPSSADRRPDDARISENRIPDGRLQQLQDLLGGFLIGNGFFGDEQVVRASTEDVRCAL